MANDGVGVSFGAEYRREHLDFAADFVQASGQLNGAGGASPPVNGGYDVYELFGEARMPLVQDQPWAKDITARAGLPLSRTTRTPASPTPTRSPATGRSIDGLRFRAGYNRAVRAPNVVELFSPQNVVLDGTHRSLRRPDRQQPAGRPLRHPVRPDDRPGPGARARSGQPVQRPDRRQPEPEAGNRRHLHRGRRLVAELRAGPELHGRLLRHQGEGLHLQHRRRHDHQRLRQRHATRTSAPWSTATRSARSARHQGYVHRHHLQHRRPAHLGHRRLGDLPHRPRHLRPGQRGLGLA